MTDNSYVSSSGQPILRNKLLGIEPQRGLFETHDKSQAITVIVIDEASVKTRLRQGTFFRTLAAL